MKNLLRIIPGQTKEKEGGKGMKLRNSVKRAHCLEFGS